MGIDEISGTETKNHIMFNTDGIQHEIKNVLHYFIVFCCLFNEPVSNSDDHD
jgi:hypothetical protein